MTSTDTESAALHAIGGLVSRETVQALKAYAQLLLKWNRTINLISAKEVDRVWSRHISDSLGLLPYLPKTGRWLDVGSGGGLPILPLAIVSRETNPAVEFVAVESDQRKAVFLREAARQAEVSLEVIVSRVERLRPLGVAAVSARAVSHVGSLLAWTEAQRADGAALMLLKGVQAHRELTEASVEWHIRYQSERHPLTKNGYILRIQEAYRAENS